jgi:hypothetical protein
MTNLVVALKVTDQVAVFRYTILDKTQGTETIGVIGIGTIGLTRDEGVFTAVRGELIIMTGFHD